MALRNYSWQRGRELISGVPHLTFPPPNVVVTDPFSGPGTYVRSIWYPMVVARWQLTVGTLPPLGWWNEAQVTMSLTYNPDGGDAAINNEMGEGDPPLVSLGYERLYPELTSWDTAAGSVAVVWKPLRGRVEFETQRTQPDPTKNASILGTIWTLDDHGVFTGSTTSNCRFSVTNYWSALFSQPA